MDVGKRLRNSRGQVRDVGALGQNESERNVESRKKHNKMRTGFENTIRPYIIFRIFYVL